MRSLGGGRTPPTSSSPGGPAPSAPSAPPGPPGPRRPPAGDRPPGAAVKVALLLDYTSDFRTIADGLADLERAGLDQVWVPEPYGFDAFSQLGYLAARTRRAEIGTAIVNVFSRTPATIAMSAAGCDYLSDGRFNLGLGASGLFPQHSHALFGGEFLERDVAQDQDPACGIGVFAEPRDPAVKRGGPLRIGPVDLERVLHITLQPSEPFRQLAPVSQRLRGVSANDF